MSHKKSELYRWEAVSKPRVYSRSQRVTKDDDIHNWIQKVEDASGKAAAATFGTKYTPPSSYHGNVSNTISATVADVHLHDAAYAEAQELLQEWVSDKLHLDDEMQDYSDEAWTRKTQTEIRREWDHLVGESGDGDLDLEGSARRSARGKKKQKADPYDVLHTDEDSLVDAVLQTLMDKEVVGDDFTNDLGLEDKRSRSQKDPRMKMMVRQQQVKENREKRERDKERKLREQRERKDAQFKARQIVQKEEQDKLRSKKREEEAIQREMTNIRKQMDDERRKKEEDKQRELREREAFSRQVHEELEHQRADELRQMVTAKQQKMQRGAEVTARMVELQQFDVREDLKCLQRCFSAWYNSVVETRLTLARCRATADWRLLQRAFKGWKARTITKRVEREARIYQEEARQIQRKHTLADGHYRHHLLQKCFLAWQLFQVQSQNEESLHAGQDRTKNKMAAFLDAAATGKLWEGQRSPEEGKGRQRSGRESGGSTARQVNDLFTDAGRSHVHTQDTARSDWSASNASSRAETPSGKNKEKQLWQLSRKDVQVTKAELARHNKARETNNNNNNDHHGNDTDRTDTTTNSARKKPATFVANQYEHRHKGQQKILENQQKQIKEQQRLIEDMQFMQKQQLLQQQLTQQQLLRQQLEMGNVSVAGTDKIKAPSTVMDKEVMSPQGVVLGQVTAENLLTLDKENVNTENGRVIPPASAAPIGQDTESTVSTKVSKTTASSTKHKKFLNSMEERAAERKRLKEERDEKKRKADEEHRLHLLSEQEERQREEEEAKRERIEAYREKKRLEKLREDDRLRHQSRLRQLTVTAEEHSRLAVVRYRGWLPWRKLVVMATEKRERAVKHAEDALKRRVLLSWRRSVTAELDRKRALADDMYQFILTQRCFNNWKRLGQYSSIQDQKAARHYEVTLKVKVVRAWADWATEEKMAGWRRERMAKEHNKRRVVLTTFRAWRRFPRVVAEETIRQRRLVEMRKKVASLIPDFGGGDDGDRSRDSVDGFFS